MAACIGYHRWDSPWWHCCCLPALTIFLLCAGLSARAAQPAAPAPAKPAQDTPHPKPVPPRSAKEVDEAIRRGVEFLLKRQNPDGSWGSGRQTKGRDIYLPVPAGHDAFRAAVTALCISSLIETGGDRPEVVRSIERGEAWMFAHLAALRRSSPDAIYNNWSHAYAIQALARMLQRRPGDQERCRKIRELMEHQIGMLGRYECVDGGWAYYDMVAHTQKPSGSTMSFVTATVLVALAEAQQAGVQTPKRLLDRATASIRRQRNPDFSYDYGEYLKHRPRMPINRPGGSLGRSQACNLAMRLWGDREVTDEVLQTWLDRLFARNLWLDMGRKRPVPHESWFQVAAYFFYYGHYYAALCIEQLPLDEREPYRDQLAHVLLPLQEKDGSWWDFPLYDYHQQYGTAFALMSLGRCRAK